MRQLPFQFKKYPNKQEQEELLKAEKEAESFYTVAGDRARKCLSTEDFKSYRDDYRRAQEKIVDYLLKYNIFFHKNPSANLELYAMNISRYLTKLESLRSLLEVILKDSQKDQHNEKS